MSSHSPVTIVEPGYGKPSPGTVPLSQPTGSPVPGSAQPTSAPPTLPQTGTSALVPLWIIAGTVLVVCGVAVLVWLRRLRRPDGRRHGH